MQKLKHSETYLLNFFIIISLNINPNTFFVTDQIWINIVNILRFFLPTFCLIFFLYFKLKKKKIYPGSINSFLFLIILYFFVIFIFSLSDIKHPNILYFILYLNIIIYSWILVNFYDERTNFANLIFAISIYFIIFIFIAGYEFLLNDVNFLELRFSKSFRKNDFLLLDNSSPRTTGIARSLVLMALFTIYLIIKQKKNDLKKLIFLTLSSILLFIIILSLQSRFGVGIYILTVAYLLIKTKLEKLRLAIYGILLILFPIFLYTLISNNNDNRILAQIKEVTISSNNVTTSSDKNSQLNSDKDSELKQDAVNEINKLSTGRIEIWFNTFEELKKNYFIFGNGILSDTKNLKISVSNALLYSIYSGGILAAIIYFYINFKIIKYLIFWKEKINNNKINFLKAILILILIRCLFESSFFAYGYDLLIILIAINIITFKTKFFEKLY
jgi:hypothetical protein